MRIMTGAPMPDGADTVVRQEDTSRDGATVLIQVATALGTSVRLRGADMRAGTTVLHPGQVLRSIDIAVAAALGHARLSVGARPQVALIATGDELVPAGTAPGPAQLVDSNSPMLAAAVREAGGIPTFLGIARDSKDLLRTLLETAASSDLIVSSAGVSVGDHDWVREVVTEIGEVSTWRVAMRPGKPVLTGRIGDAIFIGLPGNPVSSSVTFELFARPVIRRMQGAQELHRRRIRVRLGEAMSKPADLETYARAVLSVATHDDLPHATARVTRDRRCSTRSPAPTAFSSCPWAVRLSRLELSSRRSPCDDRSFRASRCDVGPDQLGRMLRDLRISVTDKCNFRCPYCMPKSRFGPGHRFLPRSEALDARRSCASRRVPSLGVTKIRLTGGEPLLRTDLAEIVEGIAALGVQDIALTTNGALLDAGPSGCVTPGCIG